MDAEAQIGGLPMDPSSGDSFSIIRLDESRSVVGKLQWPRQHERIFDMRKFVLGTLAAAGLMVGASSIAAASPATPLLDHSASVQTLDVEHVAYYWNHHRYDHRSWDKKNGRWRYY
jgi:hypothetical protein